MTIFEEKVYEYLRTIPKGKVVTYGQIARHLDSPKASRAVGNALHINQDPLRNPCFKVVNSYGGLAYNFGSEGGIETQKKRLENDGVEVIGYKVNLNKYQYKPRLEDMSISELWHLFPIKLVPYKESWEKQYLDEKQRIMKILVNCPIVSINHIGSTSLHIAAKDIVDIMIEIDDSLDMWYKLLIKNGYRKQYIEENAAMVNKGYTDNGFADEVFHIHLRTKGNIKEVRFKEYMLKHKKDLKKYEELKLSLESRYRYDRNGYTEAKTPFINQIERKINI